MTIEEGADRGDAAAAVSHRSILLIATTEWPNALLFADAFAAAGFSVRLLCTKSNPAWNANVCECLLWDRRRVLPGLRDAIASTAPRLVVPIDDRAARLLRALRPHAQGSMRDVIERSVGAQASFEALDSRAAFGDVARRHGFRTPAQCKLESPEDLSRFLELHPGACVLKLDGTWGGRGIRLATSQDAAFEAYADLSALVRFNVRAAITDPFWLADRAIRTPRQISVQTYVEGCPGDVAIFCLDGEIKSAMVAQAEACWFPMGPTTFLSLRTETRLTADLADLVRSLGLSGFVGIDLIFPSEGAPYLIELNPRITPLGNIEPSAKTNPIRAAARALLDDAHGPKDDGAVRPIYAHFPVAWHAHADDPRLLLCQDEISSRYAFLAAPTSSVKVKWSKIKRRIVELWGGWTIGPAKGPSMIEVQRDGLIPE